MKLTPTQFKEYILLEAKKYESLELLKEQKEQLDKTIKNLQEADGSLTMEVLNDPIKLKEYRQNLMKKAAGWAQPGLLAEKKENNPWAICNDSTGGKKENPKKFEDCVMSVKKKHGMKEGIKK